MGTPPHPPPHRRHRRRSRRSSAQANAAAAGIERRSGFRGGGATSPACHRSTCPPSLPLHARSGTSRHGWRTSRGCGESSTPRQRAALSRGRAAEISTRRSDQPTAPGYPPDARMESTSIASAANAATASASASGTATASEDHPEATSHASVEHISAAVAPPPPGPPPPPPRNAGK